MAASRSLSRFPGPLESWIYRRRWKRQLKKAAARRETAVGATEVEAGEEEEEALEKAPATPREAARLLGEMAGDFREEIGETQLRISNMHRRRLVEATQLIDAQLAVLESSLAAFSEHGGSLDSLPEVAREYARGLDIIQTNLPVWQLARGLQLFLRDCQRLAESA